MRLFNGLDKVIGAPAEYHIVKKLNDSEFRTYEIYFDNKPCLTVAAGFSLNKDTAKRIANLLNGANANATSRPAHTSRSISSC